MPLVATHCLIVATRCHSLPRTNMLYAIYGGNGAHSTQKVCVLLLSKRPAPNNGESEHMYSHTWFLAILLAFLLKSFFPIVPKNLLRTMGKVSTCTDRLCPSYGRNNSTYYSQSLLFPDNWESKRMNVLTCLVLSMQETEAHTTRNVCHL